MHLLYTFPIISLLSVSRKPTIPTITYCSEPDTILDYVKFYKFKNNIIIVLQHYNSFTVIKLKIFNNSLKKELILKLENLFIFITLLNSFIFPGETRSDSKRLIPRKRLGVRDSGGVPARGLHTTLVLRPLRATRPQEEITPESLTH